MLPPLAAVHIRSRDSKFIGGSSGARWPTHDAWAIHDPCAQHQDAASAFSPPSLFATTSWGRELSRHRWSTFLEARRRVCRLHRI